MNAKQFLPTILAVVAVIVVIGAPFYTVDETQQVIITQFGEPIGDPITTAGLRFKIPFVQVANRFEKRVMEWDGDPNEVPTRDKKYIWIDTTGRWRIKDPLKFFQSVHDQRTAQGRLDDIIDSATRDAVTSNLLIELVRDTQRDFVVGDEDVALDPDVMGKNIKKGREKLTREILAQASVGAKQLGIELLDVRVKRINYIETVLRDVYERMISERRRVAGLYRSEGQGKRAEIEGQKLKELDRIQSEAYRTAQEIKGHADAEAIRIYADAFNKDPEFYAFLRTLESYRDTFRENTSMVLTTDSEYLQLLKGIGGSSP